MSERTCANCACYIEVTLSPVAPAQPQCRRNGPVPAQIRVERPVMRLGKVLMDKEDKPVMTATVENVFLHAPTHPTFVCFDGWRPQGVQPGVSHK
jgi:hypothetical protein